MILIVIFVLAVIGVNSYYRISNQIFRLSPSQVNQILPTSTSSCQKISSCKLNPGDILIRRYITSRTWLMNKLAHPYFTHSAMYLGDDQIVEAVGTEQKPENDIQIAKLSTSDWLNEDMNDWVIIRPRNITPKISIVMSNLKTIAADPEYLFGFSQNGRKRAACADLIFNQLSENGVIKTLNVPGIITPDYLFSLASKNSDFEIVGYDIPIEK